MSPPLGAKPADAARWTSDDSETAFQDALLQTVLASSYQQREQRYIKLRDELEATRRLTPGWDTYGAEPPLPEAITAARRALQLLKTFRADPDAIRPSAEGGVGICFVSGTKHAVIEFLNTGEVCALAYSAVGDADSWMISDDGQLTESWEKMRGYLQR